MKKLSMIFFVVSITILSGCIQKEENLQIQKVGMILEGKINDHPWDQKGYQGLVSIGDKYDVSVYYKEKIKTKLETQKVVKEFVEDGVNLIFGHGNIYGQYFDEIAKDYPDVHFVYFNGGYSSENVTSLNFNTHAMGFFAGLVAGRMTETNEVSIIAAYEWQQEIEGFYEGVKYQNSNAQVHISFMNNLNDKDLALEIYEELKNNKVDVFYPVGDYFSVDLIKQASKDGIYSIGYLIENEKMNDSTILTSTIQHVDQLYDYAAESFNKGTLKGQVMLFDFQDDIITMGQFSPDVPKPFQNAVLKLIEAYKETNLLPHEHD